MAKATAKSKSSSRLKKPPRARKAAEPAPKPKPKAAGAFRPTAHVRMYCHGLGDCFLLRFQTAEHTSFNVLVDCGIYKASPDAGRLMNQVVDDVIETTGNRLDVLVSTHEHWDHISGFFQALPKFKDMKIGQVWQAWTEDPTHALANQLRNKYEAAKARLVGLMRRAQSAVGAGSAPALDDAFSLMHFFGVDKTGDEAGAYQAIRDLMRSKNPRYLTPGQVESLGETGVRAYVLGPPADEATLRRQDIAKDDAFGRLQLAYLDGLDALLGSAGAALGEDPAGEADQHPFDPHQEIPVAVARQTEFFQTAYGFDPGHPDAFRSIDDLAFDTLGSLALRMDKHINNTSLVLAFRLPNGQVLLFPGDAQGGNWKSWADPDKPLTFDGSEKVDGQQLLAATVFYKVAHHGSHNATPRTYGLDRMTRPDLRAFVPVDHAVAQQARYGEMPLPAIMDALTTKTKGALFRSDGSRDGVPETIELSAKKLKVRVKPDAEPIERPLYCETSFDLN
jgi:hypothetical protein